MLDTLLVVVDEDDVDDVLVLVAVTVVLADAGGLTDGDGTVIAYRERPEAVVAVK